MKTDKKIEEQIKDIFGYDEYEPSSLWVYLVETGKTDIIKELTDLLNTEVQKAVEDGVRGLLELDPPAELDETAYKWWINKYLQSLKDKEVE